MTIAMFVRHNYKTLNNIIRGSHFYNTCRTICNQYQNKIKESIYLSHKSDPAFLINTWIDTNCSDQEMFHQSKILIPVTNGSTGFDL